MFIICNRKEWLNIKTYKAKISATVELIATVKEYDNGEIEIIEVEEVDEVNDFDNVRPIS